jgi:adenylosuccinate synthase
MSKLRAATLIIDLQFGSTGKGLIAGYLASRENPDTIVTAWAANAGHTYIDPKGTKYVHTMLANGVVSNGLKRLLLGPGSLINSAALQAEIDSCAGLLQDVQILIHPHAAVITQKHIDEEAGPMTKIGSTKKGVGAAMIDRIRRNPDDNNIAANALIGTGLHRLVTTIEGYNAALDAAEVVQIEGAQGYSLSLYHGMYPYCTSRDVTPAQIFADCAIPMSWWNRTEVVGTMRTFPIRVANRFNESGAQVGYSGGCYPDQREMAWEELGLEPELTTVTRLPRRIFTLSRLQLAEAIRQCAVDSLFLNFANYARSEDELREILTMVREVVTEAEVESGLCWIGFGPADGDVVAVNADSNIGDIMAAWKRTAVVNQPGSQLSLTAPA